MWWRVGSRSSQLRKCGLWGSLGMFWAADEAVVGWYSGREGVGGGCLGGDGDLYWGLVGEGCAWPAGFGSMARRREVDRALLQLPVLEDPLCMAVCELTVLFEFYAAWEDAADQLFRVSLRSVLRSLPRSPWCKSRLVWSWSRFGVGVWHLQYLKYYEVRGVRYYFYPGQSDADGFRYWWRLRMRMLSWKWSRADRALSMP